MPENTEGPAIGLYESPEREIREAIAELIRVDPYLLIHDVAERSVTACLSWHLRPLFPEWNVDCEYNREGHEVKRADGKIVFPDIIIHRRGEPNNYVVIEAKKTSTLIPDHVDLDKLASLKSHLSYRYALFLKLTVGPSPGINAFRWV